MGLDLGTVEGLQSVAIPLPSVGGENVDGLQEAHIFGKTFWSDKLGPFLDLIDPNRNFLTADMKANGFLAPESKAGSMALGTSVHKGEQQEAFDALAYDDINPRTSDQYLKLLERETEESIGRLNRELNSTTNLLTAERRTAIASEIENIRFDGRVKMLAFGDYISIHSLDQKVLDVIGVKYNVNMKSTPFNENDAQVGTSAFDGKTAAQRLADPEVKGQFTSHALKNNNSLFDRLLAIRKAGVNGGDKMCQVAA